MGCFVVQAAWGILRIADSALDSFNAFRNGGTCEALGRIVGVAEES